MLNFREPIDEKRRDELLDAIAKKIQQFGMTVPAIFFWRCTSPCLYWRTVMHFFSPIVGVFFETFEDYAYFFDDRKNVELLIQRLEAIAMEEEEERRKQKEMKKAGKQKKAQTTMLDEALKMGSQDTKSEK